MSKLKERLACLRNKYGDYDPYTDGYEECLCEIENAAAADVAPVIHGVWEKSNLKGYVWCSVCHGLYVQEDDWIDGKKWKCCPCCSAILDGNDTT